MSQNADEDELFNPTAFNTLAWSLTGTSPWSLPDQSSVTHTLHHDVHTPNRPLRPRLLSIANNHNHGGYLGTPALSASGSSQHFPDPAILTPFHLDDPPFHVTDKDDYRQAITNLDIPQDDHLGHIASNPTLSPTHITLDQSFETDLVLTSFSGSQQYELLHNVSSPLGSKQARLSSPLSNTDQYEHDSPTRVGAVVSHQCAIRLLSQSQQPGKSTQRCNQQVTSASQKLQKQFMHNTFAPSKPSLKRKTVSPCQQPSKHRGSLKAPAAMAERMTDFALESWVPRRIDKEQKQTTLQNRKDGVCFSCKIRKWQCRPAGPDGSQFPCRRCLGRHTTEDIDRVQLCFKDLKDYMLGVSMFRPESPLHGPPEEQPTIIWVTTAEVTLWVRLTGHVESEPLMLLCRHFEPHADDVTDKKWGASNPIAIAPYAVSDIERCKKDLQSTYLRTLTRQFLQIHEDQGCPVIMRDTLNAAVAYASKHPRSLVDMALDIWVGTKVCAVEKSLVGTETLGLKEVEESGAILQGLRPVPPKIDNQTDTIMIEIMSEKAREMYSILNDRIACPKQENWFEIFLTLFVLTTNVEFLIEQQEIFKDGWSRATESNSPSDTTTEHLTKHERLVKRCVAQSDAFLKAWRQSADKLVRLWQIYMGGTWYPFNQAMINKLIAKKSQRLDELEYIQHVVELRAKGLIEQRCSVVANTSGFGQEMKWAGQLFAKPVKK